MFNLIKKFLPGLFSKQKRSVLIGGLMVLLLFVVAVIAPLIAPYDPFQQDLINSFSPPDAAHFFGTDQFGRDIFSRILYGVRISVLEIFLAVGLSILMGVPLGLVAGFFGGKVDQIIMWFLDIIFSFPGILLAILIVSVLGTSLFNMLIAIAIFSVPVYGRLTRNLTLSLKQQDYVLAARALGASKFRLMFKHILINSLAPLLVQVTLTAGGVILSASSLSFLGLGVQPPTPEWGSMIGSGRSFIGMASHISLFPGLAITYTVLAFNILGDGLRDWLDPKLKNRS
ncbi:ABC transporter permease [Halanaerobium salsuginis]|jgi:glutathione transport system permease protein|uniref:Glutathione transport system permease protein n=1 Tax=Halanaerobium salsuginis TaxID=29563 RepID=A0A1I4KWT4_9FIRM|nr:ABC transporter permease [Halanaerobium salsuginis]SFL83121.1 glutathione transport system permease protein [Halanaerobium salsuginis]